MYDDGATRGGGADAGIGPRKAIEGQAFAPAVFTGLQLAMIIFQWIDLAMRAGVSAIPIIEFGIKTVRRMVAEGRSDPNEREVAELTAYIEGVRARLHSDTE